MKVVIADYPDSMMPTHDYEQEILQAGLVDCEVIVYEYSDEKKAEFFEQMKDADALLTGFIQVDAELLAHAQQLKVVSINATGYDNVDLAEANARGIGVCPVGEYCTEDVAEFAITLMMQLVKNIKPYLYDIDIRRQWRYDVVAPNKRIAESTLGIFGFGKIGKAVAKRAKALGMTVIACDPFIDQESGATLGVELVDWQTLLARADIISNHMNLNETNIHFFNQEKFTAMQQHPYFINLGRGACVVEADLLQALDQHQLKGVALDVLSDETPQLDQHPFVGRTDVIVTPHAAFYSQTSLRELQRISTENIVHYLNGEKERVFKLVSAN